jgi:hypothetical protein
MATRLDVYKSALDFAYETVDVTNGKDRMAKAVARFERDNFGAADWDMWLQMVENQRNLMGNYKTQKAAPSPTPPATPEAPAVVVATGT